MAEITLSIYARLVWEKKDTELSICDGCGEIIFSSENIPYADLIIERAGRNLIKLPYTFCDSCAELFKQSIE